MRAILTALLHLIVAGIARAEFDAAGVASAKPKASGTAFDIGTAATRATRPQPAREITVNGIWILLAQAPATPITVDIDLVRKVRMSRTRRPANVPTRPYIEIGITTDGLVIVDAPAR